MKTTRLLLVTIFTLLVAQARGQNTVQDRADTFVTALANGGFGKAVGLFAPGMPIKEADLSGAWVQLNQVFGPYISHSVEKAPAGRSRVFVDIRFKNKNQRFSCNFDAQGQIVGFVPALEKTALAPSKHKQEEVYIDVDGGKLYGVLMRPENWDGHEIVLFIAGSGPTDHDGNTMGMVHADMLKQMAEGLADLGMASLRYDKRLVGNSTRFDMDESQLSFDDYVRDAAAWCDYLKKSAGAKRVFLIGHSEGSAVGSIVAQKAGDKFVSLCGMGIPMGDLLKKQIASPMADSIIDRLKAGVIVENVPSAMWSVFRPSVQPYLISLMKYDPAKELAKVKVPVLLVSGGHDIQVGDADLRALSGASPKAERKIYPSMNHVLKDAPADRSANLALYNRPEAPLSEGLVEDIVRFLNEK